MKVLVTGGAGYIGSHTAVALAEAGFEPVLVDDLSNSSLEMVEGVSAIISRKVAFEQVDCTDLTALRAVVDKHRPRAAIHFAASKAVGESVREPLRYYRNNLLSLINLLETECRNVLFSSSCTVYGQAAVQPVTEATPRAEAASPYGNTKRVCEDILRDATAAYDIRGISLRYFNPIGAHPSARIGELPRGVPQNLLPYLTQTAAGLRDHLSIFGKDYPTPDGTCIRDYIDISDLAEAHVAALRRLLSSSEKYEVFNIGTGRGLSVLELVQAFERANGLEIRYEFAPRRAGDIPAIWADPSLAGRVLGWQARRPIEETLRAAWAWQQRLDKE